MSLPSVSVKLITFNRTATLKEVVKYYISQDYKGEKELVIINDNPFIFYTHSHPEIRIHNHKARFRSVWKKIDYSTELCRNDIIMPWCDDDIYKPWAISTAVKHLQDKPYVLMCGIYKQKASLFKKAEKKLLYSPHSGVHIIRKDALINIGGYKGITKSDREFDKKVKKAGIYSESRLGKNEIYFIWCVDKNRRESWNPSPSCYYKVDHERVPEIISLESVEG